MRRLAPLLILFATSVLAESPSLTDYATFAEWFRVAELNGEGVIPAGTYGDERGRWIFSNRERQTTPVLIRAYGVVKTGTGVEYIRQRLIVEGLKADGVENGHTFVRGQGSRFVDLTATDCKHGFRFGRGTNANAQVTSSKWTNCLANDCGTGWLFDATGGKEWFSANHIDTFTAVNCQFSLMVTKGTPCFSNVFTNLRTENNANPLTMEVARRTTYSGCYIADVDQGGSSGHVGAFGMVFGGFFTGSIEGNPQVVTTTNTPGEGGFIGKWHLDKTE